jgi:hypothetical protein
MPGRSGELLPLYLRLSLACLASCNVPSPEPFATGSQRIRAVHPDTGKALFSAGVKVWGVMLEVDNREARKVESVMAVSDVPLVALTLHFTAIMLSSTGNSGRIGDVQKTETDFLSFKPKALPPVKSQVGAWPPKVLPPVLLLVLLDKRSSGQWREGSLFPNPYQAHRWYIKCGLAGVG